MSLETLWGSTYVCWYVCWYRTLYKQMYGILYVGPRSVRREMGQRQEP